MKVIHLSRLALFAWFSFSSVALAQEPRAKAVAPENHVELKDTVSGSYFIAKPLKEKYDKLLDRLKVLQADIESERTSGADALRTLRELQSELQKLREEIEAQKILVPIAKTHQSTETITFEPGKEKLLVITADNVRLVGWEGPGIKCELEKTVLSADGKLDEAEMKGLKVVHKHGLALDKVGKTQAESDAEEAAYQKSKEGAAVPETARHFRRKLLAEVRANYAPYREFQGKDVDTLDIEGLTHEQGNRQMTLEVSSDGGGASHRSVWRRHARLILHVPPMTAVAIRGGMESLDVEGTQGSLILTNHHSHNRDYYGISRVRRHSGSLSVSNLPVHQIEDITGSVNILSTGEFANSGTSHDGGSDPGQVLRTFHVYRPLAMSCKNIRGDLTAWLGRVTLDLEGIAGKIDVRNEFGDTRLNVNQPLAAQAHRLVSEAGRVELVIGKAASEGLPILGATQFGNVRTNARETLLESFGTTLGSDGDGVSRHWAGFKKPKGQGDDLGTYLDSLSRPDEALRGQSRSAGIDLISRGGTVVVTVK